MKSRLNNINLIKKIMIGLMLICLCTIGINTYNSETVYAKDPQLKTKTFWVHSKYQVSITTLCNNDSTGVTMQGDWNNAKDGKGNALNLGTINISSGVWNGSEYVYTVTMTNANVTHYTPYLEVTTYGGGGYRPVGTSDISSSSDPQYGQNGMNRGGNEKHNLSEIHENNRMRIYIGLGFTQSRFRCNYEEYHYSVKYNANGGDSTPTGLSNRNYNTNFTTAGAIKRKGYVFNGWYCSSNGKTYGASKATDNITWSVAGNHTVTMTAQWTAKKYNVIYKASKPSTANSTISITGSIGSQPFSYNESKNLYTNPFKLTGYKFVKWNGNNGGTYSDRQYVCNIFRGDAYGTLQDTTLTAEFEPDTFTISLNNNGDVYDKNGSKLTNNVGAIKSTGTTAYYEKYDTGFYSNSNCSSTISKITIPVKVGHTFLGYWDGNTKVIDENGNFTSNHYNYRFSKNTTLTSHWKRNEYTLTIKPNGYLAMIGTNQNNQTFTLKYADTKNITSPTRRGYTFKGWNITTSYKYELSTLDGMSGNNIFGSIFKMGDGNSELIAQWEPNIYTIECNKQGGYGGTDLFYEKYDNGYFIGKDCTTQIPNVAIPTKIGYTFEGYYTSLNYSETTKLINKDGSFAKRDYTLYNELGEIIEIYAKWEPKKNVITLDFNGGENTGKSTTYFVDKYATGFYTNTNCTTEISKINPPKRKNYKFAGYSTSKNNPLENAATADGLIKITDEGNIVAENTDFPNATTLYAIWIPKDYKINLDSTLSDDTTTSPNAGDTEFYEKYTMYDYLANAVPITNGSLLTKNLGGFTGKWKTFVAPYTGTYTFKSGSITKV